MQNKEKFNKGQFKKNQFNKNQFKQNETDNLKIGRIASRNKNDCLVYFNHSIIKLKFPKKQTEVYAGDWVYFKFNSNNFASSENKSNQENFAHQGQLLEIIEPKHTFYRQDIYANKKIIARNCTQVALVLSLVPKINFLSIDATLALCKLHNLKALIVVNKSDLKGTQSFFEGLSRYQSLSVEVVFSSTIKKNNSEKNNSINSSLEKLKQYLVNESTLMFGMSGVGKSSIIQQFFPNQKLTINKLVEKTSLGKHTTSQAELYRNESFELIDTAGMGNETISYFNTRNLDLMFSDFYPFLNQCKYRNCLHMNKNANCEVIEAVNQGKIHQKRLAHYQILIQNYCFNSASY